MLKNAALTMGAVIAFFAAFISFSVIDRAVASTGDPQATPTPLPLPTMQPSPVPSPTATPTPKPGDEPLPSPTMRPVGGI